jgi:hypothetical protein
MIPDTASAWNLDLVTRLVEQGIFENDRFDFKEMLPASKDDTGKRRLRRDIAAFSNSSGGFLIYGVKDDKTLPCADRVVGIAASYDFPEQFGSYARACEPTVEWTFKNDPPITLDKSRVIHVVQIHASHRKPHGIFEDDRWWFTKRTNKGTEWMTYEELRMAFLDTGRRLSDLAWMRAEVCRIRDLALRLNAQGANRGWNAEMLLNRFDVGQLKSLRLSVFADLRQSPSLVMLLNNFMEHCTHADTTLIQLSSFAFRSRVPDYSIEDAISLVSEKCGQIYMFGNMIVKEFDQLVIGA